MAERRSVAEMVGEFLREAGNGVHAARPAGIEPAVDSEVVERDTGDSWRASGSRNWSREMAQVLMFFAPIIIGGAIAAIVGFYFASRERAADKASKASGHGDVR